jgi:hypothetical protein
MTVTLPAPLAAQLRQLGGGNASEGVRALLTSEREALRVLGAIVSQHVRGRVDVPEEALLREYTVSRTDDPATLTVRFRAELADET